MIIRTGRFELKDFCESDREAFVGYQMDPRYGRLYGSDHQSEEKSQDLFDLFLRWQSEEPRQHFQFGIFEQISGRLCGSAGLRKKEGAEENPLVLGVELHPDYWGRYRVAIEVLTNLIDFGFGVLGGDTTIGITDRDNVRVARLGRWFGAQIISQRNGARDWMIPKGWHEVAWALSPHTWDQVKETKLRSSNHYRGQSFSYEAQKDRDQGRARR